MGTSLKGKNLLPEGANSFLKEQLLMVWKINLSEFFPLRAVPYVMENHFYHIRRPPLNVTICITHVRNCVMGATPMHMIVLLCHSIRPGARLNLLG